MSRLYRRGNVYWGRATRKNREFRRSLKTANRAIAEKRLRAWLDELDAVAYGDKPRRSYAEAEEKFIREHLTAIRPSSAKRYGISLMHWSAHLAGDFLHQIGTAKFSSFEAKRRAEGVTPSTIRRDFACLSSLMTSCVEWEWIDGNPVPAYVRRRARRGLKESAPRTRYLTEAEETALIAAATPANALNKNGRQAGKGTSCREAIVLAIDTGLRRNELFGLRWPQIDLDRGLITTGTRTKSGRPRLVPVPERARTILGTLTRRLDTDFVLVNPATGERYVTMEKGLQGAARRAGISDLDWHDLRRTAGCRWLQRDGKTLAEVSMLLGHSSVRVTEERYAFLDAEKVAVSLATRTKSGTSATECEATIEQKQQVA